MSRELCFACRGLGWNYRVVETSFEGNAYFEESACDVCAGSGFEPLTRPSFKTNPKAAMRAAIRAIELKFRSKKKRT